MIQTVQEPRVPWPAPEREEQQWPVAFRWTAEAFERAIAAEVFPEDARLELIKGQLVEIMVTGPTHAYITHVCRKLLEKQIEEGEHTVSGPYPVTVDPENRFEPDVWIAAGPISKYKTAVPTAADLFLVVEVSDSTLYSDRNIKLPIYAAAAIPEYWIINVKKRQLERHRQPQGTGEEANYGEKVTYACDQSVEHERLGTVVVADLLGEH